MALEIQTLNKPIVYKGQFLKQKSASKVNINKSNINFTGIRGGKLGSTFKNLLGKCLKFYVKSSEYVCYGWGVADVLAGLMIDFGSMKHNFMLDSLQNHLHMRLDVIAYGKAAFDFAQGYMFRLAGKESTKAFITKTFAKLKPKKVKGAEKIL